MAQLIDHLWQSALFVALMWFLAWLTRRNLVSLRLWMWRLAALKFLLPFGLLYAVGGWLGFPVRHSAIPPPDLVVDVTSFFFPLAAPAQTMAPASHLLIIALVLVLLATVFCGLLIRRQLIAAQRQRVEEVARAAADWSDEPRPLGFFKTATLSGISLIILAAPIFVGAVHDRLVRQEALAVDIRSLRSSVISLRVTKTIFGARSRIVATSDGVSISHINLQDLVAEVYGIGQFEVFGGALPWLTSPHYDVQVKGPVHTPAIFDPYSLRQSVTGYLYQEYGVAIRVNGRCQEPCLNQQSFTIERLR